MTPIITAFAASPDGGRGLARDMPVRWALEEVGLAYDVRPVSFAEMKQPEHLALQPFGQIPTYQEEDFALFESGAIVLHIAQRHGSILPEHSDARVRAIAWMFAAKSTVEPVIVEREAAMLMEKQESWYEERLPILDQRVGVRLSQLSQRLGEAEWLDGEFTAGDLMMISTLRRPAAADLLKTFPNLSAYVVRGEARPAFRRAFEAQRAAFLAGAGASVQ